MSRKFLLRLAPLIVSALLSSICAAASAEHVHEPTGPAKPARPARAELATSVVFAPDGALVAVFKEGGHVVLQRSIDMGRTWAPKIVVNAEPEAISADGENRPKVAFSQRGAVLVSWTRPLAKPFTGEIRYARAGDGEHFTVPVTVHRDRAEITHRFDVLGVSGSGQVFVAWIDKRDSEAARSVRDNYRGAAIYAAVSNDDGVSFEVERKVADHSCECCRIGAAIDRDGRPLLMWRHVFSPNERDHALTALRPDGSADPLLRVTQDRWKVDACPHHGPSLAIGRDGVRHAVWFNHVEGEGSVFYGRLPRADSEAIDGQRRIGGPLAAHADVAVAGSRIGVSWREFDGRVMRLRAEVSDDGGRRFRTLDLASAEGAVDQPRVLARGDALFVFWRTEREGMRIFPLQ